MIRPRAANQAMMIVVLIGSGQRIVDLMDAGRRRLRVPNNVVLHRHKEGSPSESVDDHGSYF
jgi:hypothetical protein